MQLPQRCRHVIAWAEIQHQTSWSMQHSLEHRQCWSQKSCKDGIAVIKSWQDEGWHEPCRDVATELPTDGPQATQMIEACLRWSWHVNAHRELSVDHHSKVTNDGHWLDVDGANANAAVGKWDLAKVGGGAKLHHLTLIGIQLKTLSSTPGNDVSGAVCERRVASCHRPTAEVIAHRKPKSGCGGNVP